MGQNYLALWAKIHATVLAVLQVPEHFELDS
jgi:hypothetical protein